MSRRHPSGRRSRAAAPPESIASSTSDSLVIGLQYGNPTAYSGVLTSPFFGEPTPAAPARRIEIGTRITS